MANTSWRPGQLSRPEQTIAHLACGYTVPRAPRVQLGTHGSHRCLPRGSPSSRSVTPHEALHAFERWLPRALPKSGGRHPLNTHKRSRGGARCTRHALLSSLHNINPELLEAQTSKEAKRMIRPNIKRLEDGPWAALHRRVITGVMEYDFLVFPLSFFFFYLALRASPRLTSQGLINTSTGGGLFRTPLPHPLGICTCDQPALPDSEAIKSKREGGAMWCAPPFISAGFHFSRAECQARLVALVN